MTPEELEEKINSFCQKWVIQPPEGVYYLFITPERELKSLLAEFAEEVIGKDYPKDLSVDPRIIKDFNNLKNVQRSKVKELLGK